MEPQRLGGERPGGARLGAGDSRTGPDGLQRAGVRRQQISLADLIVLAGGAAIEPPRPPVTTSPCPSRRVAPTFQEQTDVEAFAVLEPQADGFRNYLRAGEKRQPETLLLDRANLLTLTAPEMTVLAGLRALGANSGGTALGVLTDRQEPSPATSSSTCSTWASRKPSGSAENADGRDGDGRDGADRHRG